MEKADSAIWMQKTISQKAFGAENWISRNKSCPHDSWMAESTQIAELDIASTMSLFA